MLSKTNRLTKDKEFENIFNPPAGKAKSSYDKLLGVKMIKNGLTINRFGIIISAKVSKKATTRNKVRRQIREIIKKRINELSQGHDFVFICLTEIGKKSYKEIENSIIGHFIRLKVLRKQDV